MVSLCVALQLMRGYLACTLKKVMDESKCDTGERLDNNVNDVIMTSNMKSLPEDDSQRLHIYAFKVYVLQQSKSLVSRCFKEWNVLIWVTLTLTLTLTLTYQLSFGLRFLCICTVIIGLTLKYLNKVFDLFFI